MKYILIHLIAKHHIKNINLINKLFYNHKVIIIIENELNLIEKKFLPKHFKLFEIKNIFQISNFLKEERKKISFALLSTSQARLDMIKFIHQLLINFIPIYSIEETHQMYLHNSKLNNYLIPSDILFACSEYEKNELIKQNYNKDHIIVTGWYFDGKINNKQTNDSSLIILNATNNHNPNSIESYKIQNTFISAIKQILKKNKIIIKLHPLENKNNYNQKLANYFHIDSDIDIRKMINESNYVFSTGYTQSIIEAISLKKNVYIYEIEKNLNIYDDLEPNLIKKNKLKNFSTQFDEDIYKDFKKINNLYLNTNEIEQNIKLGILKSLKKLKQNKNSNIILLELSIWLYFFRDYKNSTKIIDDLFNIDKILNYRLKIITYLFKNEIDNKIINDIINEFKNENIFYPLKYIIFRKIISKKEEFKEEILKLLKLQEPDYLRALFYNDFQYLLTFSMTVNKSVYRKYELQDTLVNKNIMKTKNFYLRLLIITRKIGIFVYFPFINNIVRNYIIKKLK